MRELNLADLDDMALGATLLGAGGGGDPYIGRLMAVQAIETYGAVQIVEPSELDPDGLVVTVAGIGAPTVLIEKPPAGPEFVGAALALAKYLGKEPVAIMPIEVGGLNTLIPLAAAADGFAGYRCRFYASRISTNRNDHFYFGWNYRIPDVDGRHQRERCDHQYHH